MMAVLEAGSEAPLSQDNIWGPGGQREERRGEERLCGDGWAGPGLLSSPVLRVGPSRRPAPTQPPSQPSTNSPKGSPLSN